MALIDGKAVAASIRARVAASIQERIRAGRRAPGLVTIVVGDDPASRVYVAGKQRASREVGIASHAIELPDSTSRRTLADAIEEHNRRGDIDGILVQLPLPRGLDADDAVAAIDPGKDVDGLHPLNQGALFSGRPGLRPCTPAGCMVLLDSIGLDLRGLHAVVIGRSVLVGKPVAMMLLERNATVVMCHSQTSDLARQVAAADVVIAAVGRPELVRGEWIKPGAVVIDVGINRVGTKLVGDVEHAAAAARASHITPVPGGVGPMTVAMLLANTLSAYEKRENLS